MTVRLVDATTEGPRSSPEGQGAKGIKETTTGALQQLMGHFPRGIEGLQPGAALPGVLARLFAPALQAQPAAVKHQLKTTVAMALEHKGVGRAFDPGHEVDGIAHGNADRSDLRVSPGSGSARGTGQFGECSPP